MSRTTPLPPLLEPYLALPPETALLVLTGVLGASTNWLVLRYLHALLKPRRQTTEPEQEEAPTTSLLLVSFLRDYPFWRDGCSRLGLDLDAMASKGRFGFVDGLGGLFTAESAGKQRGRWPAPGVGEVGRVVDEAVDALSSRGGRVVVVVDGLDLLVAASGRGVDDGEGWKGVVMGWREKVHAMILTLAADEPLITAQNTALEKGHAAFVLSLAHEAQMVASLRLLDTGTAKDVSGVLRITGGGDDSGHAVEEKEYLYHVGGDGGVRVFERGQ
ncbi:hypothetical protein QBC39DRAFT_316682 [Podospora conica]|nr:hypothetical protein QBC39DRAFT_316682 [Schizothecium conicum]